MVSALENDPEFRAKLDKADEADIRVRGLFNRQEATENKEDRDIRKRGTDYKPDSRSTNKRLLQLLKFLKVCTIHKVAQ